MPFGNRFSLGQERMRQKKETANEIASEGIAEIIKNAQMPSGL